MLSSMNRQLHSRSEVLLEAGTATALRRRDNILVGATLAFGGDSGSLQRNRLGRAARASASARGGFWARPRRVDSQTRGGGARRFLLRFLLLLTARDRGFTSFCRVLGRVVLTRTLILASSSILILLIVVFGRRRGGPAGYPPAHRRIDEMSLCF
jgi:hypothetical protein